MREGVLGGAGEEGRRVEGAFGGAGDEGKDEEGVFPLRALLALCTSNMGMNHV